MRRVRALILRRNRPWIEGAGDTIDWRKHRSAAPLPRIRTEACDGAAGAQDAKSHQEHSREDRQPPQGFLAQGVGEDRIRVWACRRWRRKP